MHINFKITNIDCPACVKLSKSAIQSLPGVKSVEIDQAGLGKVEGDDQLTWEEIEKALAEVDKMASLIK